MLSQISFYENSAKETKRQYEKAVTDNMSWQKIQQERMLTDLSKQTKNQEVIIKVG